MDDLQGKERQNAFEYSSDDSARTSIASELEESFGAKVIMVEPATKVGIFWQFYAYTCVKSYCPDPVTAAAVIAKYSLGGDKTFQITVVKW